MLDCPDSMSIEECLKNKLKKKHLQKDSNKHNSTPPLLKIKSQQAMASTLFKETTLGKKSSNSSGTTSHALSHHSSGFSSCGGGGSGNSSGGGGGSGGSIGSHGKLRNIANSTSKGGVVIQNQSVIVKSNFEMAGRLNKQGKRNNAKTLGSHASASLNYMENHGARDLEKNDELSNIYDENGERLSKQEYEELKNELNAGVNAFRRTIVDVGHNELDREDLNRLVRESVQEFQEKSGKQFDYAYAIHTDTDHIHAHVLSYGQTHEINMTKEHLQLFKQTVGEKTNELLHEHKLENDRDLSLNQQINGALEYKNEIQNSQYKGLSL
jgi:hypothetical protein